MDPITLAIIAAITAGVVNGTTDVAKEVIVELYAKLKDSIIQKYGKGNDLEKAINSLEKRPKSDALQKLVEEEIASVEAHEDQKILNIAQMLLEKLNIQSDDIEHNSQTAIGYNIVQADRGGKASLNITRSGKDDHA